jgi:hypothetical protein
VTKAPPAGGTNAPPPPPPPRAATDTGVKAPNFSTAQRDEDTAPPAETPKPISRNGKKGGKSLPKSGTRRTYVPVSEDDSDSFSLDDILRDLPGPDNDWVQGGTRLLRRHTEAIRLLTLKKHGGRTTEQEVLSSIIDYYLDGAVPGMMRAIQDRLYPQLRHSEQGEQ